MKVLIIDDDRFITSLFTSEFAQENIAAPVAHDGVEGLALLEAEQPDVVVLDMILPKKDGFEMLEHIAAMKGKRPVVYAFSSLAQENDREEALRLGAKEYFVKDRNTVRQVVEAIRSLASEANA
jgi:DNA-binding response OmpR family regulator